MKNKLSLCILCFIFLVIAGCGSGGGVQDIALITQAKKEIKRLRNALEEYKLDYETYPAQGSDLKVRLAPYLSKFFYYKGEETSEYTRSVLSAQNNLNQVRNALSGFGMIKEPEIKEMFSNIQKSFELYVAVLNGKDEKISSVSSQLVKLKETIENLKIQELKILKQDSLIEVIAKVIVNVDSLIPNAQEEELKHFGNIRNTFRWYESELLDKKLDEETELYSPQGELTALKENEDSLHLMQILPLQELIESYYEINSEIDYCDFLVATQKDIDRALKLVSMLDDKMPKAKESSIIVQAEASLQRMADVIRDYRKGKGEFPKQDVNIDSILHPYFVETTMSGGRIDRWQNALNWFYSGPIYESEDPYESFTIKAEVNNPARTPIFVQVRIENKWDEVVNAFSGAPIYTTSDSIQTYFIKARANDNALTWVTERPPK